MMSIRGRLEADSRLTEEREMLVTAAALVVTGAKFELVKRQEGPGHSPSSGLEDNPISMSGGAWPELGVALFVVKGVWPRLRNESNGLTSMSGLELGPGCGKSGGCVKLCAKETWLGLGNDRIGPGSMTDLKDVADDRIGNDASDWPPPPRKEINDPILIKGLEVSGEVPGPVRTVDVIVPGLVLVTKDDLQDGP